MLALAFFLLSALITRDRVARRPKRGPTYRTLVVCAASHQPLLARPPRATQLCWAALLLAVAFFLVNSFLFLLSSGYVAFLPSPPPPTPLVKGVELDSQPLT